MQGEEGELDWRVELFTRGIAKTKHASAFALCSYEIPQRVDAFQYKGSLLTTMVCS